MSLNLLCLIYPISWWVSCGFSRSYNLLKIVLTHLENDLNPYYLKIHSRCRSCLRGRSRFSTKRTINLDKQSTPLDLHFINLLLKELHAFSLSFLIFCLILDEVIYYSFAKKTIIYKSLFSDAIFLNATEIGIIK